MAGRYELFHLCPTMTYPAEVTTVWGGMLLSDMTTPYLEVFSSLPLMHLCHPPTNNEGCPSKCCPRSECTCAHPPSPVSAVARVGAPGLVPPELVPPGLVPPGLVPPGLVPPGLVPPELVPPELVPQGCCPQSWCPQGWCPQSWCPRIGAPRVGAPRVGAPRVGAPRVGAPRIGAPRVGAPRVGAPNYTMQLFISLQ